MHRTDRTPADVDAVIRELSRGAGHLGATAAGRPVLQEIPTADAERVRGHLLAAFETRAAPDDVLDLVAEELRTSASPVVLAGAARALRGLGTDENRDSVHDWPALLRDAAERLVTTDVFVRWLVGVVAPSWMCTARAEILAVLEELPAAPDVRGSLRLAPPATVLDPDQVRRVWVEDQSGAVLSLADLLSGRPTLLALFYTRCTNPAKCSLTITRLAALVAEPGPRTSGVVAMSYDPAYDSPSRLRRYGTERGFASARTPGSYVPSTAGLTSGRCSVCGWAHGPVTVNEHARELFRITPDLIAQGLDPDVLADPDLLARLSVRT